MRSWIGKKAGRGCLLPLVLATGISFQGVGETGATPSNSEASRSDPAAAGVPKTTTPRIGWEQLPTADYPRYLDRLRGAGCPEERVRLIVRADADEWLLQQRVSQAVANDFPWWKAEPVTGAGDAFSDKFEQFRARRNELVQKLLGELPDETSTGAADVPIVVNLAGPVLGALSREKFNAVQEICARSLDRHQGYYNNRQNEGIFLNQGDLARMREQTRTDLAVVLTSDELEEFLLLTHPNSLPGVRQANRFFCLNTRQPLPRHPFG